MSAGAPSRRRPQLPPGYRVALMQRRGFLHPSRVLVYESGRAGPAENPVRREKKRIMRKHGLSGRGWRRFRKELRRLEREAPVPGGAKARVP